MSSRVHPLINVQLVTMCFVGPLIANSCLVKTLVAILVQCSRSQLVCSQDDTTLHSYFNRISKLYTISIKLRKYVLQLEMTITMHM